MIIKVKYISSTLKIPVFLESLMREVDDAEQDWNENVIGLSRGAGDPDVHGYPARKDTQHE